MSNHYDALSRNAVLKGTAAAAAGLALATGAAQGQDAPAPAGLESEFLFELTATLEPPQQVGVTPHGNRLVFIVTGGTISGPKVNGKIVPSSGGDWFRLRPDGVGELDVRATVEMDDGALVYVHYTGVTHNKTPDGSRYFRITPRFETASEKYDWLNNIVAVGVGRSGQNEVSYTVYTIL